MDASEILKMLAYHDARETDWERYFRDARFYADEVIADDNQTCSVRILNESDDLFDMWMDGWRDDDGCWVWDFNKYIFFNNNPSDQWDNRFQTLILREDNVYRYEDIECICDNAIAEFPNGAEHVHVTA